VNLLLARDGNSGNSCHKLSLPLLVLRLKLVNNVDTTLTTNDFVVGTDLFNTCTYFHIRIMLLSGRITHCLNY
jgi:hypothetical protein